MADLTGMRHGAVEELVPPRAADPRHTLRALVPLAHLLGYASSVRFTVSRASSKYNKYTAEVRQLGAFQRSSSSGSSSSGSGSGSGSSTV